MLPAAITVLILLVVLAVVLVRYDAKVRALSSALVALEDRLDLDHDTVTQVQVELNRLTQRIPR